MNSFPQIYHSGLTPKLIKELQIASEARNLPANLPRQLFRSGLLHIWLKTDKYRPNHFVTMRNDVAGWGRDIVGFYDNGFWKFTLLSADYVQGMNYKFLLDHSGWMQGEDLKYTGAMIQYHDENAIEFDAPDAGPAGFLQPSGAELPIVHAPHLPAFPGVTHFQIWFRTDLYREHHVTLRSSADNWQNDIEGQYEDGYWKFTFEAAQHPTGFKYKLRLDGGWMKGDNAMFPGHSLIVIPDEAVHFDNIQKRYLHSFDRLRVQETERQQTLLRGCYDEKEPFDVIIVGSGMGGGNLADALTDRNPPLKVLVLDSGSLTQETHIYNSPGDDMGVVTARNQVGHYDQKNLEGFGGEVTMNIGGRSVFWSGIIPRMQPHELKQWPEPLRSELSKTGYDAAEKHMRKFVSFGDYEDRLVMAARERFKSDWTVVHTPRAQHQPERRENPKDMPPSIVEQSSGMFSTAELLTDSMSVGGVGGRNQLFVNANHLVTHFESKGKSIQCVVCRDLMGGVERKYQAKYYVLAAGSMESVRIAVQSGLREDHPWIGKGFTDHPSYFVGYDKEIIIPETSDWAGPRDHARIFFYPKNPPEGIGFNVEIGINGRFWRERHADNDIQSDKLNSNPRTTVNFKFCFGYPLNDENFVDVGGERGKLKVKIAKMKALPGWRAAVEKTLTQLLQFFGVTQAVPLDQGYMTFGDGGTPHHSGGTLRLGAQEDKRVVDTDLKFTGRDNLYACDVSVYPYIPAANPSLTLTALALRLAEHLTGRIAADAAQEASGVT